MFNGWLKVATSDYENDVDRINQFLRVDGKSRLSRDFPPHTFVGNIENLKKGDSVLLIGINPKESREAKYVDVNINLPKECLAEYHKTKEVKSLADWYSFQCNYFLSENRNKRHFGKVGRFLSHIFPKTYASYSGQEAPQMVCHKHLIEVDLIPYFSENASFSAEDLLYLSQNDKAVRNHHEMIFEIIKMMNPRLIIVNGKSTWDAVESVFSINDFENHNLGDTKRTEVRIGNLKLDGQRIPVFMHKFLGSINGLNSNEDKLLAWNAFLDYESNI